MNRTRALLLSVCLLLNKGVYADHLPDSLLASGVPEKVLAGFNLDRTKLSEVIAVLGQPTKVDHERYVWLKRSWTLGLIVYFPDSSNEYVEMIRIEGKGMPASMCSTGKGLRLGDSLKDLRRIYGNKYFEHKLPSHKLHEIMIQWRTPEISLIARLDVRGRIYSLSLSGPE